MRDVVRLAGVATTAIVTGATGQDGVFPRATPARLTAGASMPPRATLVPPRELFGGHQRLFAVPGDLGHPEPLAALVGEVQADELYNLAGESSVCCVVRRPMVDLGDERACRRPSARRDPQDEPRHALLPGVVRRDVRFDARRRGGARRGVRTQSAEPVRGREGGRAHALPQLPRVVRRSHRLRDSLQPRVAPARPALPLAQGRRPPAHAAAQRTRGPLRSET